MTRLALLWHMHQPFYEDLATGEHILPWVRLHAIKDYWGMVALLREFPAVRVTFNLVPSLVVQIQAFADGRARDRHLDVGLKPAAELDAGDRQFLIANGFHAPVERMIRPYRRYAELHARRQRPEEFSVDDLRDLQVWHKLVWMDPDWLLTDARLKTLLGKPRGYTEGDKLLLRDVELELLKAVIPAYREAAQRNQVELSTSPFYHPILPLLCDTDLHLRAHPHSALPHKLFARPEDAMEQLRRAIAFHEAQFGRPPAGVWPSEGSVSDEVIAMMASVGLKWTATDEEILARSLQRGLTPQDLYRPYEVGQDGRTVRCLFRHHGLSDTIGFTYQSWDAESAAEDFMAKVRDAGRQINAGKRDGEVGTVTVILDGDNAWEYYPGGGRPFLRALYRRLQNATDIQTVSMSEAASAPARRLTSIFPGSWINGDFYIWAGHRDDHRAWAQLRAARDAFDRLSAAAPSESRERAWEALLIAEGSDWFWWYGDDHSSDQDREFDDLFRRNLRNVYRALGEPAPDELHISNITTLAAVDAPVVFRSLESPVIDGQSTAFGEWADSVTVSFSFGGAGTMHRVAEHLVRDLQVTADLSELYFRLDGPALVGSLRAATLGLEVLVVAAEPSRIRLERDASVGPRCAAGTVVEAAVPFAALGAQAGDRLRINLLLTDLNGHIVEQHPAHQPIELVVPTRHLTAINWVV